MNILQIEVDREQLQRELLSDPKICSEKTMNVLIDTFGKKLVTMVLNGERSIAEMVGSNNGELRLEPDVPIEIYECAVRQDPNMITRVLVNKKHFPSVEALQRLWKAAVRVRPSLLSSISPERQSDEIILEALKTDIDAIRYVKRRITKDLLKWISSEILDE